METLASHKNRPLHQNIDNSGASLRVVMRNYAKLLTRLSSPEHPPTSSGVRVSPESEAFWFYAQQHSMSIIAATCHPEEPLREFAPYVASYHDDTVLRTMRMFYYILLICTRETRHAGGGFGMDTLKKKYKDSAVLKFYESSISGNSRDQVVANITTTPPDITLGEYTEFLVDAFKMPKYASGYGGKAWAAVAKPLRDFAHGRISAVIFMDTAFTLAHNNGPIFNKGILYDNYCNKHAFYRLLDVQRSGQVPQLVNELQGPAETTIDGYLAKTISSDLVTYVTEFSKLHAGFSGNVDWSRVRNIGGGLTCSNKIKTSAISSKVDTMHAVLAKKIAKKKSEEDHAAMVENSVEILPGVFIPKCGRG